MLFSRLKYLFVSLFIIISFSSVKAQNGLCPSNLDFEMGDFTGWECRAGSTSDLILPVSGPIPGRHTIITTANAGTDPFGGFPTLCPNGSGTSVKLGNHTPGSQAESISFTYTIPSNLAVFSMLFYYAVVIESPGHTPANQPRFQARIIDLSTGNPLPCVNFDFIAGSTPGGFLTSPLTGNIGSAVLYKEWTPISVNLNDYIGRTILLEFITKDCSQSGHAGYAYLDVSTVCNGAISGSTICQGDNSITLNAPFGFQFYTWYTDLTYSTILATTQTVVLNPPPAVGTVFPVKVEPFAGFGCLDTLKATITVSAKPVSLAGPDVTACQDQPVQIGGPVTAGYTYLWTATGNGQVSNAISPNPFATILPNDPPTEFYVLTTDLLTGCFSMDTTVVSRYLVDTSMTRTGKFDFCVSEAPAMTLTVKTSSSPVQWYDGNNPIPGATGISYRPLVTGSYWAQLSQGGCMDSTSIVDIGVHPLPLPSFTASNDTGCVTKNNFLFTNTGTSPDAATMTHLWKFSDATQSTLTDATKIFLNTGIFNIELVSTTSWGCKDSTDQDVLILPNGKPDFTWDSVCVDRPVQFTNLSDENGSPQVNYVWDFSNGGPGSSLKYPLPVMYSTRGNKDVTLKLVTLGCENDTVSIVKTILANKQADGIRYRTVTVPQGSSHYLHVRDTVGTNYNWRPKLQLSSYYTQYTEFFATTDDIDYRIDITDVHTCVTTDSVLMQILRKPGYYLPSAFTPNGDGLNDVARPYLVGMKSLKSFSVFNRWGNLVFYSTTYGQGWDGKNKGVEQDAGVYVWILEYITPDDKKVTEKGTITIIR